MRFSKPILIALIALAKLIVADSQQFGIVSIASGTDLQYASGAVDANNNLVLGHNTSSALTLVVTDNGKLKSADGSEYFTVEGPTGVIKLTSSAEASVGFSIKNGHLMYLNSESFIATPIDGSTTWQLTTNGNGSSVVLRAQSTTGADVVADFIPDSSSPSSTTTVTVSSTTDSVSSLSSVTHNTVSPTTIKSTGVPVSQIDDGQIQASASNVPPIQSDNGAQRMLTYGVPAGLAAAAALLLI
ncbi:uncharacterized protein RNJ42_03328 [Nakaseomyces bracarensis]|uniref:uncharacterized protein n=1 Tax=Nakaseomyces bracarensis TaxID=273131 RepID=UPI003872274F